MTCPWPALLVRDEGRVDSHALLSPDLSDFGVPDNCLLHMQIPGPSRDSDLVGLERTDGAVVSSPQFALEEIENYTEACGA